MVKYVNKHDKVDNTCNVFWLCGIQYDNNLKSVTVNNFEVQVTWKEMGKIKSKFAVIRIL